MLQFPVTWVELSKSAVLHNLAMYKNVIGTGILAPIVKSNAYGHGLVEIAQLCQESPNADWLCTATLSDAILLRKNGIIKPLLVLSYIDVDPNLIVKHGIEVVVYNKTTIQQLNEIGKNNNCVINVHLKIDTGMSRLGIMPHEALSFITNLTQYNFIKIQGICTHLSESGNGDQSFTQQQLTIFNTLLQELTTRDINIPLKHAANSAGTTGNKNEQISLYRLGIGLYGLWPSEANKHRTIEHYPWFSLRPVLTWKTRILEVKTVPAGSYVGYDRTYKTNIERTIAIVPIGYYEGYDRRLSNIGAMILRKNNKTHYAHVIGRVCMNLTMLDVTGIPDTQINDEVIVMGDDLYVRPSALAVTANSHNAREMTTKISPTIPRIIVP